MQKIWPDVGARGMFIHMSELGKGSSSGEHECQKIHDHLPVRFRDFCRIN